MWCSPFRSSLPNIFTATNSKTVKLSTGKIQLNALRAKLLAEHRTGLNSYIECVNAFAVIFADPRSGNVANFTPYWAQYASSCETNFDFSSPSLHSYLLNLLKSSRHVTSRNQGTFSRWRENPVNEVASLSDVTTVFVDTRLWKTKHRRKRFQNFRQSCVLLTDRIEIHQSQPLA